MMTGPSPRGRLLAETEWLAAHLDDPQVRVVDMRGYVRTVDLGGGLARWRREGRPLTREVPAFPPATFTPRVQPSWRATGEAVLEALGDPGVKIVDARDEAQYTGKVYRVHEGQGRAGHIPGALSLPREALIDPATGRFRPVEELWDIVTRAGIAPQERIIAYCNGGVAATTVLFGLALAGPPHLTNYDG